MIPARLCLVCHQPMSRNKRSETRDRYDERKTCSRTCAGALRHRQAAERDADRDAREQAAMRASDPWNALGGRFANVTLKPNPELRGARRGDAPALPSRLPALDLAAGASPIAPAASFVRNITASFFGDPSPDRQRA